MEIQVFMQRRTLRKILGFLYKVFFRVEAIGLENIPPEGTGCILAVNHLSRLDPPLVFIQLERQDASGLVADKYQRNPFIIPLVETVDGIWVNRDEADFRALREARNYLRNGGMLGIAPEGTRSNTKALIPAKTGVAYLADQAKVAVMPTALFGTENAIYEVFRFRRPKMTIHFDKPFMLPPIDRSNRDEVLQRNTDEIMCRIAALLPSAYWGAYTDHPRLKELLSIPPGSSLDSEE
jgi:1-acyl-sn-glycerol-3-phosphate acyltransferase